MTFTIRETAPGEYRTATEVVAAALMAPPPSDERWERSLPSWEQMVSYSAWDGDSCIGHVGQFVVDTVVPGGARVATGAVSRVGVLPTARRRGVATALMHELVRDAARREFPLMSLRASESTIYERFGFGLGGEFCQINLHPRTARPVRGGATDGSFRLLRPDEIADVVPELYDRVAFRRPGVITRPSSWTQRLFHNAITGEKASFVVVHTNAEGVDDGYAHYETEWDDDHADGPTGKGEILDVFGATDAVELALWQYLCDVDLVTTWKATERPIDDLVRFAATDVRAYRVRSVDDEQWLRLVDVDRALTARTYRNVDGAVCIAVTDPILSSNDGVWRVDAGGAQRVERDPDLSGDVAAVSAPYLGGASWKALVATGRITEHTPGAAAIADDLFRSDPLPFCGTFF